MAEENKENQRWEEKVVLAEYQLREKIEKRLWERIKLFGTIAALGLTIVGLIGFRSFVDIVAEDVKEEVKAEVFPDIKKARENLEEDFRQLTRRRGELEAHASVAGEELSRLQAGNRKLEEVSGRYETTLEKLQKIADEGERLARQYEELQESVNMELAKLSADIRQETQNLREDVASARSLEKPTIISIGTNRESGTVTIRGANFGDDQGQVHLMMNPRIPHPQISTRPILLSRESITTWTNDEIRLKLAPVVIAEIESARDLVEESQRGRQTRMSRGLLVPLLYEIETATLSRSKKR